MTGSGADMYIRLLFAIQLFSCGAELSSILKIICPQEFIEEAARMPLLENDTSFMLHANAQARTILQPVCFVIISIGSLALSSRG
jgi:hypothetical protein